MRPPAADGPASWPVRAISIGESELACVEAGTGDAVVFVHGTLGDYRSWFPQLQAFASHFRAISYSRRYHYPNPPPVGHSEYSAALHAEDLLALADGLGLERFHLVSSSYGSYVALLFARDHPDRVRSVVVGEPPMLAWLAELEGGADLAGEFTASKLRPAYAAVGRGETEEGIRLFIDGVNGKAGTFDRFPQSVRQAILDNAAEFELESRSDRLFPTFRCDDGQSIRAPALLLEGQRSPALFKRITDALETCLPSSERVTIAGASHAMNAARPRLYNQVVLDWLERITTGA